MKITDAGFQDFRQDASCLIRPQSLLGEKYVDCKPTQPRAPGAQAPPPLAVIPDGQPGAGQHFLPLENNGKEVDLDLVNNIMREPYADRFRLILNDLGAGLAARGKTLDAIVKRADPALRADRPRAGDPRSGRTSTLAQLADDSDTDPDAARARARSTSPGSSTTPTPPARRPPSAAPTSRRGFAEVPGALRELRSTMAELQGLLRPGDPGVRRARHRRRRRSTRPTEALGPFADAADAALTSLGDAAAKSQEPLVNSDPIIRKVRKLAKKAASRRQEPRRRCSRACGRRSGYQAAHASSSSTRPAASTASTSSATSCAPLVIRHELRRLVDAPQIGCDAQLGQRRPAKAKAAAPLQQRPASATQAPAADGTAKRQPNGAGTRRRRAAGDCRSTPRAMRRGGDPDAQPPPTAARARLPRRPTASRWAPPGDLLDTVIGAARAIARRRDARGKR